MPAFFSHLPLLPLIQPDEQGQLPDENLLLPLARIAPLLIPVSHLKNALSILPRYSEYWAHITEEITANVAIALLDAGATKIVTTNIELFSHLPADRLVLALNDDTMDVLADDSDLAAIVQSVLLEVDVSAKGFDKQLVATARSLMGGKTSRDSKDLFILPTGDHKPTIKCLESLAALKLGTTPCLPTSILSAEVPIINQNGHSDTASSSFPSTDNPEKIRRPSTGTKNGFHLPIDVLFLSSLTTDRPDSLYATLVSNLNGPALGLVYSSPLSISMSILTAQATYQSRSRSSLWVKGATSGATQKVIAIRRDCDGDALEFIVEQKGGTSFCHTLRATSCFGPSSGLTALESTLNERKVNAPQGSYTNRLFQDPQLLEAKLREEAEEVCQAKSWEETKLEAADLLYFLMVRCAANNVNMADVQEVLDARASKVTRRPGNAKAGYIKQANGVLPHTSSSKTISPAVKASDPAVQALEATTTALPAAMAAVPPVSTARTQDTEIIPAVYDYNTLSPHEQEQLLKRPLIESKEMLEKVQPILQRVRSEGDSGMRHFVSQFDRCPAAAQSDWDLVLRAPFDPSLMQLSHETKTAIDTAYNNIHMFHSKQMDKEAQVLRVQTMPGIECTRFARAISRVGLYIPGGTAVLPSTALMLCIPASIAGCSTITVATPPDTDGRIRPEIVYIAHKCGVKQIVRAGGAQAIASLAYGTETITKADKIFGPGNQWVTAAKMAVSMDTSASVSIDMPAGPSEVLVIADETANPVFAAADLLSQAEHGPDSQVVLLAINLTDAQLEDIKHQVSKQALALPRVDIVRQCISKSLIVKLATREEAFQFSNDYAPEHLILHIKDAAAALPLVQNAGSVFVGKWSPESLGDYASGTNHTLPTMAYARQYSGVSTSSFLKHITSQELTLEGLKLLGPTVDHLARIEGLDAHARAVTLRLSSPEALQS